MNADAPAPRLWFEAPVGFAELPLHTDPAERTTRVLEGLDLFYPQATVEQKLSAALAGEAGLRVQAAQGLVYGASCRYRADDGQVIHGLFQLYATEAEVGEALTFAQRHADALAEDRTDAEVGVLGLPCGRALVATEDKVVPVPGWTYGIAEDGTATVRQLEALLAHPGGGHLVTAVFGTEDLDYWEQWLPIVAQALRGVSFYPPAPPEPSGRPESSELSGQPLGSAARDRIREAFG